MIWAQLYFESDFIKMSLMDTEYFPKGYDNFKIFLFKKVERISLALYLSTNHLSDEISLKTNIRAMADIIIKDILQFNRGGSNVTSVSKIKEDFLEIKSLIYISTNCNLINQNNAHILLEEITKLGREIENQKDNFIGDSEFKKSFFVVESRQKLPEPVQESRNEYKGHKGHDYQTQPTQQLEAVKESYKGQTETNPNNQRTDQILKIIKDNRKVTIKDISTRIKNCSEKTIQRELIKMVSLNLIKKEGERRWSTYSVS